MRSRGVLVLLALAGSAALLARSRAEPPHHTSAPSASGNLVVTLCDGVTSAEIPGVKEGERPTHAQAEDVASRLMAEWRQKNPQVNWDEAVQMAKSEGQGGSQGGAGGLPATPQGETQLGHTYGAFSERDERIWAAETFQ